MAVIEITQLPSLDPTTVDDTIGQAAKIIQQGSASQAFAIGTQIQDPNVVQITSDSDGGHSLAGLENVPSSVFHVNLNRPAFGVNSPAAAPVVEFVQVWFPASKATSGFRRQIEDDIQRFDELFKNESKGDIGFAVGWVEEEQSHESIKDEKAKCFLVMRGWENMEWFERSLKTESFKKAIPILYAWEAPSKMWHVGNKVRGESGLDQTL